MKDLKCPMCGEIMTVSIGPLHPMAAVAADMLKYGVILRCSMCMSYSSDVSQIECPQCENKTLISSLDDNPKRGQGVKIRTGKITCKSCGWRLELH